MTAKEPAVMPTAMGGVKIFAVSFFFSFSERLFLRCSFSLSFLSLPLYLSLTHSHSHSPSTPTPAELPRHSGSSSSSSSSSPHHSLSFPFLISKLQSFLPLSLPSLSKVFLSHLPATAAAAAAFSASFSPRAFFASCALRTDSYRCLFFLGSI